MVAADKAQFEPAALSLHENRMKSKSTELASFSRSHADIPPCVSKDSQPKVGGRRGKPRWLTMNARSEMRSFSIREHVLTTGQQKQPLLFVNKALAGDPGRRSRISPSSSSHQVSRWPAIIKMRSIISQRSFASRGVLLKTRGKNASCLAVWRACFIFLGSSIRDVAPRWPGKQGLSPSLLRSARGEREKKNTDGQVKNATWILC